MVANTAKALSRALDTLLTLTSKPEGMTTPELFALKQAADPTAEKRTLERDLLFLEKEFSITCETKGRTNHWKASTALGRNITPGLSKASALALIISLRHNEHILPESLRLQLRPWTDQARQLLSNDRDLGTEIHNRIAVIDRGPHLAPAEIESGVFEQIYQALNRNVQIDISIQARGSTEIKVHKLIPLGIVSKERVLYLVGQRPDFGSPYLLALHRMLSAQIMLGYSCPADTAKRFDDYVNRDQELSFPHETSTIELKFAMTRRIALHLLERQLSNDQKVVEEDEDNIIFTATVVHNQELEWWLLGFGDDVEVLEPPELREFMAIHAANLANYYDII